MALVSLNVRRFYFTCPPNKKWLRQKVMYKWKIEDKFHKQNDSAPVCLWFRLLGRMLFVWKKIIVAINHLFHSNSLNCIRCHSLLFFCSLNWYCFELEIVWETFASAVFWQLTISSKRNWEYKNWKKFELCSRFPNLNAEWIVADLSCRNRF